MAASSLTVSTESALLADDGGAPSISLSDVLRAEPAAQQPPWQGKTQSLPGVVIGRIKALDERGTPLVDFDGNSAGPLPARSTAVLDATAVGSEVALLFESGDATRPIVIGAISRPPASDRIVNPAATSAIKVEASADGARVTISASREVELRCGQASITLTRAGKVLIRGAYVLSRSSGENRIKGASVQIN